MNKPNLKLGLFVLILLPVLLALGFWQLNRAEEKRQLLAEFNTKRSQPAVSIDRVLQKFNTPDEWQYLPVTSSGTFDQAHVFLLDNQVFKGRVGYEIIAPFKSKRGNWYYVSRGWIPGSLDRRVLPEIPVIEGSTRIVAEVYVPDGKSVVLSDDIFAAGWPKVSQRVDVPVMNQMLNIEAFPYVLRLSETSPSVLERHWQVVNVLPEKHTAYAVQWFSMAFVLVALFIWTLFKPAKASIEQTKKH